MDPRLLEAAQNGDVDLLKDLIKSNGRILEEVALQGAGHMPLHVACVAGHSNFVRELLRLKPKLAEKVNADGYSPLHIAAARGDVEIVREILTAGQPRLLCLLTGRERRIPLHCAAANGEVSAMKELLSASPESIEETTAREETALHLSVKNNRFYALFVLVEHLKQHNKEQVINWKDKKGNTILHLAAAAKNFEVVDFMLSGRALKCEVIEVNALNDLGSTPLDVLSDSDRDIKEIFKRAGAEHGKSEFPSSEIVQVNKDGHYIAEASSRPSITTTDVQEQQLQSDTSSNLLVVATLIASATYQAVLQPITLFKKLRPHTEKDKSIVEAFFSILNARYTVDAALCVFLITNTVGFFLSVYMIGQLTTKLQLKVPLWLATLAMVGTYLNCLSNVPSRSLLDEDFTFTSSTLIVTTAVVFPILVVLFAAFLQRVVQWITVEWITEHTVWKKMSPKTAERLNRIIEFLRDDQQMRTPGH